MTTSLARHRGDLLRAFATKPDLNSALEHGARRIERLAGKPRRWNL